MDKPPKKERQAHPGFRQRVGTWGENLAAEYLQQQGFRIIGRNVRTAYGEIDIIAQREVSECGELKTLFSNQPLTIFVEVKTRRSLKYGYPEQAVDVRKKSHLLASAQEYIQQHPEMSGDWRLDVIAIIKQDKDSEPQIRVFENAITDDE